MRKFRVCELFAGVGGFRVGLNHIKSFDESGKAIENDGHWDFVWADQYEPKTKMQPAYECYKARFGGEVSNEDITLIDKTTLPEHDLLVGGFPCQDYSVAVAGGGKGLKGKRGTLFWEIIDILKAKQTPFVLLENVENLLRIPKHQRGRDFGIILKAFDDCGYDVAWRVINAADYGFPTKRNRVYILAWNRKYKGENIFTLAFPYQPLQETRFVQTTDIRAERDIMQFGFDFDANGLMESGIITTEKVQPLNTITPKPVTLGDVLESADNIPSHMYLTPEEKTKAATTKAGKRVNRISKHDGRPYVFTQGAMSFPDDLKKPARTMITSESAVRRESHFVEDENGIRRITPIEAERIMTFPDNWTNVPSVSEKSRYYLMGNALVCDVIAQLEPYLYDLMQRNLA
jgi:DNA (cytosine-5)-methyltransferase 1